MEEEDIIDCIDFETDNFTDGIFSTPERVREVHLRVGMEFQKIEDVQAAYAQYGKSKGFQIRIRNSRPKLIQFVCYREGFAKSQGKTIIEGEITQKKPLRYTKTCKCGCRASLNVALDAASNMWRITKFEDDHNHEMVSPNSCKYLRTHKNFSSSARCLSQIFEAEGIAVSKVMGVLNPNNDEAEFSKKDCYNYMTRMRQKILDHGDAQAVHTFCVRQQELNPNFRYAIQLDEDDRMVNFFWVDARSRAAYLIFGEVVSFDTTYKTNKYNMPFAPFVGIDNHMHTIMFGCALLQDESEETFIWLFEAWKHAMGDKLPLSFVTDQDMAIMNAVRKVFPTTRHRLCLWHIKKKFPERLTHIYHENSSFKGDINSCIHDSLSIQEFESTWKRLVSVYDLAGNDWFNNLFEMRGIWVPIFCKDVFFGGMSTTGRSESINSFFDAFVHSGTTLKEFVNKYNQALESRYETFRRAEFDSRHKIPMLILGMGLEEHAGQIYTSEIFKLFHIELRDSLSCIKELVNEADSLRTYRVGDRLSKCGYVVVEYNFCTRYAKCECLNFEFKGILCKHILSVLHMHNVEQIPPHFIMSRWTKDVGRVLWELPISRDRISSSSIRIFELKVMFDDMCKMCEVSDCVFDYVKEGMNVLNVGAKGKLYELHDDGDVVNLNSGGQTQSSAQQLASQKVLDPNVSQTKGRKKNPSTRTGRIRSGIEIASDNTIKCSVCLTNGHNRRTCPKVRERCE